MIPLRHVRGVARFPSRILWAIFFSFIFYLSPTLFSLWQGRGLIESHSNLVSWAFVAKQGSFFEILRSSLLHHHLFSWMIQALFFWAFAPRFLSRVTSVIFYFLGVAGSLYVLKILTNFWSASFGHTYLFPEIWVAVLMGMSLRKEIWGTLQAWVIGPGFMGVYWVPPYVFRFFWLFYVFLGNLFRNEPFILAPMSYGFSMIAVLMGVFMEQLHVLWRKRRLKRVYFDKT